MVPLGVTFCRGAEPPPDWRSYACYARETSREARHA
jgi:hypothetical protein